MNLHSSNEKMRKNIIITFILAVTFNCMSAENSMMFKVLDASNGLNSSQVNCVLKDMRGFVWVGTPAGLYRYDGYEFKNYQSSSREDNSLPNSCINSVQEDNNGNLWIQTASGTCVYDPNTDTFERDMRLVYGKLGMTEYPNSVFIDSRYNLWMIIKNKGVKAYNMIQKLMYDFTFSDDAHGLPEGTIVSIGECRDGAVLVYDDGRLVCCDISHTQRIVWQANTIAGAKLRKSESLEVFADHMDNVWLYGRGTLMVYNKSADTWDTTIGNQIGMTGTHVDRSVNGMVGDRKGNIWIATDEYGLIKMNVNTREMMFVNLVNGYDQQKEHQRTPIQSLYVDDTDLLWVGTERSGLALGGTEIYKFTSERVGDVTALAQDGNGKLWYGTSDRGVVGYNGPIASMKVKALACTADGSLWIGSKRNGLTRVKDGKATMYSVEKDGGKTIIHDAINALCTDKAGNLWIATEGGLQVYNPRMNTFSSYTRENGKLITNIVTSLFYGAGNNMFIGTNEGLVIQNLSSNARAAITGEKRGTKKFTNNYITQVIEDSRGLLWIGTREGLNIYDRETDHLDYLTDKEGLSNNCICGLTEDKNHNVWVTTSNGATRIVVQRNYEEGSFNYGLYNYNTTDGLLSNEFNAGAILTMNDGNILLGGLYGVSRIRTGSGEKTNLQAVMFTSLYVGEEEIRAGHEYDGRVLLPFTINESTEIRLPNDKNTFTIKFSAGNYNLSERLMFMYRLEGRDESWRNGDPLLHGVTFTKLRTGKYTLHVKAISADGSVSDHERMMDIIIEAPWWLAWWMLLIYVAIIAVIVYLCVGGIRSIRSFISKKRAVIKELTIQREEIKAAADDLNTPMSRMTSIISDMAEKADDAKSKEQISSMHFQLLQIITRLSEMQSALEKPEDKAEDIAAEKLSLTTQGDATLVRVNDEEIITSEVHTRRSDSITMNYTIVFIDDSPEVLNFVSAHLRNIYNVRMFDSTQKAAAVLEELHPDIVVCKQDMKGITGSEMCNAMKRSADMNSIKFVLMTEGVLTQAEMQNENITLSADDYLAKPFNVQETIMRFNKLLGLAPTEGIDDLLIEGKETRQLEGYNSSMTTASMSGDGTQTDDESIEYLPLEEETPYENNSYKNDETIGDYSMNSASDRQLMRNVEQYVLHNMGRGRLDLEEMATAMGMGNVPFYRKIKNITGKTPAEYVRELRLKHACTLLVRTNINLSELAINLGFVSAENFSSIFREKFGMLPVEYRESHRK